MRWKEAVIRFYKHFFTLISYHIASNLKNHHGVAVLPASWTGNIVIMAICSDTPRLYNIIMISRCELPSIHVSWII